MNWFANWLGWSEHDLFLLVVFAVLSWQIHRLHQQLDAVHDKLFRLLHPSDGRD